MSAHPVDVKEPIQSELPVYRLNEGNEELTVGGATPNACQRVCLWKRFHCRRGEGQEAKKKCCIFKWVKRLLVFFLVLGIAGFFFHKYKMNCMMKHHPITCVPLTEDEYSVSLPLANEHTHIGLHPSLTGGDASITHSDDVPEGTAVISFELPGDTEFNMEDPELYVCHVAGPKFVGLGVHPKDKHHHRVKAVSTTITLSSAELGHSRSTIFMGRSRKFRHFRKIVRKMIKKAIERASEKPVDEE